MADPNTTALDELVAQAQELDMGYGADPAEVPERPSMTAAERLRWWTLHGATIDGSDGDRFAMDLAARGLIEFHDGMANANYWIFTEAGRCVYFGSDEDA